MPLREKMIDQMLYAANAQATLNSFVGFAEFLLDDLMVWFQGVLRQPGLQSRKIVKDDLYGFTRHLQLAGELGFDPTDSEYPSWIFLDVPNPVPPAPPGLYVSTVGSSCVYVTGWTTYELWSDTGVGYVQRDVGIVRPDESGVDFSYTGIIGELMRVMVKSGTFYSFPTNVAVVA